MILTIIWHVNPFEGSVIPPFLKYNFFVSATLYVLLVTCMPVWILCVTLLDMLLYLKGDGIEYIVFCVASLLIQAVLYFFIGKLVSVVVRVIRKRLRRSSNNTT